MMPLWAGLFMVLLAVPASYAVAFLWQRRGADAETARKAVHIGNGLAAATFPWLFAARWPGVLACAIALLGVLCIRLVPGSGRSIGRITGSVDRDSWGDLLFPMGIGAAWLLAHGTPTLYVVPVLMLTLADAAAALVGTRLGRHTFRTQEGHKSIEGLAAFFVAGAIATFIPVYILNSDVPLERTLLIAVLMGGLLAAVEALCWRGLDNLTLPVVGYFLIQTFLDDSESELWLALGNLVVSLGVVLLVRRRLTLIGDGLIAALLFLFASRTLGGAAWLMPPAAMLAGWLALPRHPALARTPIHSAVAVFSLTAPALALLLLHAAGTRSYWMGYVAAFAATLVIVGVMKRGDPAADRPDPLLVVIMVIFSSVVVVAAAAVGAGLEFTPTLTLFAVCLFAAAMGGLLGCSSHVSKAVAPFSAWIVRLAGVMLAASIGVLCETTT